MASMGRLQNSIALAKASWQILRADKELLLLPVMSGIATILVAASFILPMLSRTGITEEFVTGGNILYLALMYFVLAYITIFFNAALVSAAHERLEGGDPTLRSALAGAASRAGRIIGWALISAVVSIIIRAIEERAGFLGRIVIGLVGMAWSVVTFLVLPIIVIEGAGAGAAVKRSATLFRSTWGENLSAQVGLGIVGFLAMLPAVALMVLGALAGALSGVFIGVGVLWIVVVAVVIVALSGIFQTALYHFAVDGQAPSGYFDNQVMADAFRTRRSRRGRNS